MKSLLDILWPRSCELCGRPVDRPARYLCSDCLMRLPTIPTTGCCRRCGRDVPALDREFLCDDCRTYHPSFDRVASVLRFEEDGRQLLLDFKFKRHLWLLRDLVDLLEGVCRARFKVGEIDLIAPVPTTFLHRLDRGCSPVADLAAALAKRLDRPVARHLLKRVGSFERQAKLDESQRRENVIGTFAVTARGRRYLEAASRPPTVLLVDDVMTTGSTLSECAKTIKNCVKSTVWCVTVCRSVRI